VLLHSSVARITKLAVTLKCQEELVTLRNDAVVVCAGGILPISMLRELGVMVETKFGTA
jgi:hypothetical protein